MADKPPKPKTMPKVMNFIIGGTSGMMAISVVQPADLLKTRMQLLGPAGRNMSALTVAKEIVKNEGFLGFYVGLSAALFRQATYTTGRLGVFNAMFDMHKASYGVPNFPRKILMGIIAGGIGAFIGTPAEVALIRMTADGRLPPEKKRNYKNVFNAMARIIREEGLTTLWRGASATVSRAMVVNGAQLGSYAQAREMLLPAMGDGLPLHTMAAMISGFITTVASLPVDIVKTRVQNSGKGTGQIAVLANIIKNEGVLALWSGMLPTYAKIGPMTVLVFIFLEQLNAFETYKEQNVLFMRFYPCSVLTLNWCSPNGPKLSSGQCMRDYIDTCDACYRSVELCLNRKDVCYILCNISCDACAVPEGIRSRIIMLERVRTRIRCTDVTNDSSALNATHAEVPSIYIPIKM